jgi:hypothetical protein
MCGSKAASTPLAINLHRVELTGLVSSGLGAGLRRLAGRGPGAGVGGSRARTPVGRHAQRVAASSWRGWWPATAGSGGGRPADRRSSS